MSPKSRGALNTAIKMLLDHGHPAKALAHRLGLGKDAIYRAAPEFFARRRRKKAT